MKKIICLTAIILMLFVAGNAVAQEKFIDVREDMAKNLTQVKKLADEAKWEDAKTTLLTAKDIWANEVKTLILEDQNKGKRFSEYFDRLAVIETNLEDISSYLTAKDAAKTEETVNATIWSISHQPAGFKTPPQEYTAGDWIFGLSIGFGTIILAIVFGLYLRRSFYKRYAKAGVKIEGRAK